MAFSISQPNSETTCNVDTFQVAGTTNKVPVICGDNEGQHSKNLQKLICFNVRQKCFASPLVYLFLGKDATSVQLMMSFGSSGIGENRSAMTRLWRIKIGLLPCYADYLGIQNILQISIFLFKVLMKFSLFFFYSSGWLPAILHGSNGFFEHF